MNERRDWRPFRAVAITTHPIPAYGGFEASIELLEGMAKDFNARTVPMHAHHDLTSPIRTRDVRAEVRERQDGYHELALVGLAHPDDWERVQHLPGMSVTLIMPLGDQVGDETDEGLSVRIAADAGWFDDDAIIQAALRSATALPATPARAYQFSLVADPQIYIDLSLAAMQSLGPNLAASAIWDGLKHLFGRRRVPPSADPASQTVVNFSVTDRGWTASVESNDPDVVSKALETLAEAATTALAGRAGDTDPPPVRWDTARAAWLPVTPTEAPELRPHPGGSPDEG